MPESIEPTGEATQFEKLPDAPTRRGLKLSWPGKMGVGVVVFWLIVAFIGPSVSPYHEADILDEALFIVPGSDDPYPATDFQPPSKVVWLGTDYLGRDTLSRTLYGARTTIGIALLATLLAFLVGATLGIAAAVGGTVLDSVLSRTCDLFLAIPHIITGLVVIAAIGSSVPILVVLAGLIYSTRVYRIARALAHDIMVSDFVEIAQVRGEGLWWIIRREILPNAAMPLTTDIGMVFVYIIIFIASLGFLGVGVQPPQSDWGSMVRENLVGLPYGSIAPLVPILAIVSLTIAINVVVDDVSAHAGGRLTERMV